MRHITRWAGLALALIVTSAPALRADDAKVEGDLKKLQGTWVRAGDEGPDSRWVFEGNSLKASVQGMEYVCKISVDEKAKPHATIDIEIKEGPGDAAGKSVKGIYKFDGDKLVLAVSPPPIDTRPADFQPVQDQSHVFALKKE